MDHYKRLTLNYHSKSISYNITANSGAATFSSQLLPSGQVNLFKYNSELVDRILTSEKFRLLETALTTFDVFKHTLESIDETKLDEIYSVNRNVVKDYKNSISLLAKINKLMEVQHIFCEKILMTDIFDKICELVCVALECDRSTLYIFDNVRNELWSRASKDSATCIRLALGKGLAGYVAETKTNLVLDDAYFDPRFNRDYDIKTGYRTKSVLCVPVLDYRTRDIIGVIQALNKKSKPFVFDVNDEITSELLARMIANQVKHSMEYSDFTLHESKLKRVMNVSTYLMN